MKKQYKEPIIDLVEFEVEQGIAQSLTTNGGFGLTEENAGYGNEEEVIW